MSIRPRHSRLVLLLFAAVSVAHAQTDISRLLTELHSPDPVLRDDAAQALGRFGDPRAVGPLIAALRDPNVHVGKDAATALGRLHATAAIPALVRNLLYAPCGEYDGEAAADALAAIGTPAVPALVAALRNARSRPGTYIVDVVGQALDGMRSAAVVPALKPLLASPDPGLRNYALERVVHHAGPAAVSAALPLLHNRETSDRALDVLGANLNDPRTRNVLLALVKPLIKKLANDHGEEFTPVGTGLYMRTGPAMDDNNSSDGVQALHLLAKLHDPALLPLFLQVLDRVDTQESSPLGLSEILAIGPSAVPPLIAILTNPTESEDLRGDAALALGSFDDPRAVPPLLAAMRNPSRAIREGAFQGEVLGRNPVFVDTLLDALANDQSGSVRQFAAQALRTQHDPRVARALIAALKDNDQAIRSTAIEGITAQHITDAVPGLILVLQGATGIDSDAAGLALGQLGDRRALAPLVAMLTTPHFENCWVVIDALRQLNVAAEQPAVLQQVRRDLAQTGKGDCNGNLQNLDKPPLPAATNQASDDGAPQPPPILKGTDEEAPALPALQPLLTALRDPNPTTRLAAAKALRYRDEPAVTHALVPLASDPNPQIRHAAADALSGCPAPTIYD